MICTSTPVRSSTYLSTGFNLPTLRSIGFGSSTCDFGRAHPVPHTLRCCGLSVSLRLSSLRSLASPQIETPWPVIQNGRMDPVSTAFRPLRSLGTTCGLSSVGFRLFSPPFRGTFQRSFALLLHYRSQDVFRIGRLYLPASRAISNARSLRIPPISPLPFAYGTFTLYGPPFQARSASKAREYGGPLLHISPPLPGGDSVCPLPFSIAFTHGISVDFLSSPY